MASNKFFTWTKGDRKHTSVGMNLTSVECNPVRGMECSRNHKRSSKAGRKPLPLEFVQDLRSTSRSSDSIALHDAAIKSATTLMAVMNDMLKSPPLTAHLLSTQSADSLQLTQGRPRSRTAPSTPMYELPDAELAELPGSIPPWCKPSCTSAEAVERSRHGNSCQPRASKLERGLQHVNTSPRKSVHLSRAFPRRSLDSYSRKHARMSRTPRKQTSPYQQRKPSTSHTSNASDDTLVGSECDLSPCTTKRPSLKMLRTEPTRPSGAAGHESASQRVSEDSAALSPTLPRYYETQEGGHQPDADVFMAQIMSLHITHDAHVESLRRAHAREMESHRAYINVLEGQRQNFLASRQTIKQIPDSSLVHDVRSQGEAQSPATVASAKHKSGSSLNDSHRRALLDSAAETEALKRKLSLCLRSQAEHGDLKVELERLRENSAHGEKKVLQLKEVNRKAKDEEKAMMNKIASLEAAVRMGNVERTDVLEGLYEARDRARSMSEQQKLLIKERDEARNRLSSVDLGLIASSVADIHASNSTHDDQQCDADMATLNQELNHLRRLVTKKDARIDELEKLSQDTQGVEENEALIRQLDACQRQLSAAQSDRDQYNDLLHAELRRQSRSIAIKLHAATPQISDGPEVATVHKSNATLVELDKFDDATLEQRCKQLEHELKHCTREIILYKMDVRGYKKDLKKAQAQVESLREQRGSRPQTCVSLDDHGKVDAPAFFKQKDGSGLGISLSSQPHCNTTACHPASPAPHHQRDPSTPGVSQARSSNLPTSCPAAPTTRNKLPLAVHKQLPATPVAELGSHNPSINRAETVRSLSDSIISSYAKRGTPEMQGQALPPSHSGWRCSEQPRRGERRVPEGKGAEAVAVPVLKFKKGMVRTPILGVHF